MPPDNATVKPTCNKRGTDMPCKFAFLLLFALAVTAAAESQDKEKSPSADKSMILALENAWNQAELHHDAGAADAILADTFISVDHHGKLETKREYMAGIKDTTFNPEQISNIRIRRSTCMGTPRSSPAPIAPRARITASRLFTTAASRIHGSTSMVRGSVSRTRKR